MSRRFTVQAAPKCIRCHHSVYVTEQVLYDGQPYHQSCFKCLECKTTMTMSMVAQINGQLYCKNCFKKIFKKEGKYTSFETKKSDTNNNAAPLSPSKVAINTNNNTTNNNNPPDLIRSPSSSSIHRQRCVVQNCGNYRVSRNNYCAEHANAVSGVGGGGGGGDNNNKSTLLLFDAIQNKNTDKVKEIIKEYGLGCVFQTNNKGITALEYAFGGITPLSRQCGLVILEFIQSSLINGKIIGNNNNNNNNSSSSFASPSILQRSLTYTKKSSGASSPQSMSPRILSPKQQSSRANNNIDHIEEVKL